MVLPLPPLPKEELGPDGIEIIACQRSDGGGPTERRTFGVRWATRPDLGFPRKGYDVYRVVDGGAPVIIGTFVLPDTTDWNTFASDVESRRPRSGPYFPPKHIQLDNLGFLLPLIALVDPRAIADREASTRRAVRFFGGSHADDPQLRLELWPDGNVPPLDDLLAVPATQRRLIEWYSTHTIEFLCALALRFEYAVLLGLATDDFVEKGARVIYRVGAKWEGLSGRAESDPTLTNRVCAPKPPDRFAADRAAGSVAHPAFNHFDGWTAPADMLPVDSNGTPQSQESLIPRAPAPITELFWSRQAMNGRLLTYHPVLYRLKRFDHGSNTAGSPATPPEPPSGSFVELFEGELLMHPNERPHALDRPGLRWPPLEGHYHYQLQGITMLGVCTPAIVTSVHHRDELAPPPPAVQLRNERAVTFADAQATVEVELVVGWHAAHDFVGPDANEFRIATRWIPRRAVPVRVLGVTPDAGTEYTGTVTIDSLQSLANGFAGLRLVLPDGEYPIVDHGGGAQARMRVRRIAGRLPAPNQDGVIFAPAAPVASRRIARLARRPAVPVWIRDVDTGGPLRIRFDPASATPVPQKESFSLYIHLLRTSFVAVSDANDVWRVETPPDDDPRAEAWNEWLALPDPAGLLEKSPGIIFPEHRVNVKIERPADFTAGLLLIDVTAADDKTYVTSPAHATADPSLANLHGNESEPATATLSAHLTAPPPAPAVMPLQPWRYLWASSAAVYAEEAYYELTWPVVAGAACYEVWRVLEGALSGATASTSGAALRSLARAQEKAFVLRSGKVFGPRYLDALPGRAPTRAFYRIRAVGISGTPGAWSDVIGPVYVPDVRAPSAPNLRNATVNPERDRRVLLAWTQAGPLDDLRFDIEMQDRGDDTWSVVALKPRGTPPSPGSERAYVHEITDLVPGEKRRFRVRAVREARDPVDPYGQVRRDIAGPPSEIREARALGTLLAPAAAAAESRADSRSIRLSWQNRDRYVSIEVLRRGPQEYRLRRAAMLGADQQEFVDTNLTGGDWRYVLRALGHSRMAETEEIGATLP